MTLKAEDVMEEEDVATATADASAEEEPQEEMSEKDLEREAELLSKLSSEQIRLILEDVCNEMLSGLEVLAYLFYPQNNRYPL